MDAKLLDWGPNWFLGLLRSGGSDGSDRRDAIFCVSTTPRLSLRPSSGLLIMMIPCT